MLAATINSLNTRLDSADWEIVWDAAVETFVKSQRTDAELFVMSKAAHAANIAPGRTFKAFIEDVIEAGYSKSPATLKNYKLVWPIAALTVAEDVDPLPKHVAMAYTIVGNVSAATRGKWLETAPESVTDRVTWLEESAAQYRDLDAIFSAKPAEEPEPETEESSESVTDSEPEGNGFDGQLIVLQTLAARVQRGDFTVAEAVQLAQAAKGILVAAESLANESVRTPVAA